MLELVIKNLKELNRIAILLIGLFIGFCTGIIAPKYFADNLNMELVPQDSYIMKSEASKAYVDKNKYDAKVQEQLFLKTKIAQIEQLMDGLEKDVLKYSSSLCQQYSDDVYEIVREQKRVEKDIQKALSRFSSFGSKKESDEIFAGQQQANELRKYSEQLNEQIIQVREERAKCVS